MISAVDESLINYLLSAVDESLIHYLISADHDEESFITPFTYVPIHAFDVSGEEHDSVKKK